MEKYSISKEPKIDPILITPNFTKPVWSDEQMSCDKCHYNDQDVDTFPCAKCHTRS